MHDIYRAFGIREMPRRTITVRCPVHGGESLTITDRGDKALVKCGAGCDTGLVLSTVGLSMSDLYF